MKLFQNNEHFLAYCTKAYTKEKEDYYNETIFLYYVIILM